MDEKTEHLLRQLTANRRTLCYALEKAVVFGGETLAPTDTRHEIDNARRLIRELKARLRALNVPIHDEPEDTAPAATPMPPAPSGSGPFANQQIGSVGRDLNQANGDMYINSQRIGSGGTGIQYNTSGSAPTQADLNALLAKLNEALKAVPPENAEDAEAVAETAKEAVEQAQKPKPNPKLVEIKAENLKQAAQNLASVLPTVIPIAAQIAEAIRKFASGA